MDALIKFRDTVANKLTLERGDEFLDLYYQLTIDCDVKLITDQLSEKKRYYLLMNCGLLPEEIDYYNHFDTNYQNTLEYIIAFAKYDAIRHRIYAFLFSLFASKQIHDVEFLLKENNLKNNSEI
jgi:hypothetical protein